MDIVVDKVFLVELFDRFPMAVAVADRSKKIVYANKRYTELFGAKEIVQESVRCRDVFGCLRPNDNTDGSRPVKCQTCIFSLAKMRHWREKPPSESSGLSSITKKQSKVSIW